jgi:lipopolysaccharide export system permease protein
LSLDKLYEFIDKEKKREVLPTSISIWWFYIKNTVPVSAFILTIIAVSVSYKKRYGMNLTGIAIAFGYVF